MLRILTAIALSVIIGLTTVSCTSMTSKPECNAKMEKVKSSMIKAVGYDAATQVLAIEFATTGAIFEYEGVPENVYKKLMSSKSLGAFYTKRIKGKYKSSKK